MGGGLPRLSVEFLLVDGTRRRYGVGSEVTVGAAKQAIWENWPEGGAQPLARMDCFSNAYSSRAF